MTAMQKLTTLEKRAVEWCNNLRDFGSSQFEIQWRSSRMYRHIAVIENNSGEKMAIASGCGYDKESKSISNLLCWIFPHGTAAHNAVASCGGCGLSSIQKALLANGWNLDKMAAGKRSDIFEIKRVNQ